MYVLFLLDVYIVNYILVMSSCTSSLYYFVFMMSLVFRRKDLCEAKPGYRVENFDQNTMLRFGGGKA